MPSSGWESSDLLALFNVLAGRPAADAITATAKYLRLTRAQNRVIALMQAVAPNSLYPHVGYNSLPTLTTTDGGYTFTFGTDTNGYAKFPMGKGGIYQNLNDIPDYPLMPGRDYMLEGTQVRAPNNSPLPATLYWYGFAQPDDITAISQPALMPEASRELIVVDAVRQFAKEFARNGPLAQTMSDEWDRLWPIYCLVWKTQFRDGGALNCFTGLDIALSGNAYQPGI